MTKLLKYELLNRKRNLLSACGGAIVLYAIIYIVFGLLKVGGGGSGTQEAAITLTSIVFTAACILLILNPLSSIRRDFYDDSRYITFLIPCKAEMFLLSRVIAVCIDVVFYIIMCLVPFLYVTFLYTGELSKYGDYQLVNLSALKEIGFYFMSLISLISFIQFILVIYLSIATAKSFNLKKLGGLFLGIITFILSYYAMSFLEMIIMRLFGNEVQVLFNFFFQVNISIADTMSVLVFILIKILEALGLFFITSKLINERINL